MSAVMVLAAVLICTFSYGILAGRGKNIKLILDVTPWKEITWGCIWRTRWQVVKTQTVISNNSVFYVLTACHMPSNVLQLTSHRKMKINCAHLQCYFNFEKNYLKSSSPT